MGGVEQIVQGGVDCGRKEDVGHEGNILICPSSLGTIWTCLARSTQIHSWRTLPSRVEGVKQIIQLFI